MRLIVSVLFLLITIIGSPQVYAVKPECKAYHDKLLNIQSQQRQGHSGKKALSLKEREQKARDKWWQCQQGNLKKATKKKKYKKNTNRYQTKKLTAVVTDTPAMLRSNSQLTIKAKYQGRRQQAWLDYYQRPKKCLRPKTTQMFAYCLEDERKQQHAFEQQLKNAIN